MKPSRENKSKLFDYYSRKVAPIKRNIVFKLSQMSTKEADDFLKAMSKWVETYDSNQKQ